MIILETPIESVPRISKKIVPALKKLGIKTIRDLLFHFPSRYEDFSRLKTIRDIETGEIVTVQGVVQKIFNRRTFRKHMTLTEAVIKDETGNIKAIWFNQPFLARNLRQGDNVSISGKVALGKGGVYLQNPAYEKVTGYRLPVTNPVHTGGLVPIYPETRGITSRWLRFLIKNFIDLRKAIPDPLPPDIRRKHNLPEIKDAIRKIHFPKIKEEAVLAKHRFVFEELLLIQLRALQERLRLKQYRAPAIPPDIPLVKKFVASLPFRLTDAQRRSLWEILQDIAKDRPMNRLLEGDVGSGKTVVAAAAALLTAQAGLKVAFMAPTEILANQHYETLSKLLQPFHISIGLLTGSAKKFEKHADVIVGTHALIQKNARFSAEGGSASGGENLGLVVIDEQHRFGVEQRAALLKNQESPHQNKFGTGQAGIGNRGIIHNSHSLIPHFLSMSATPIPRTLALTIYGDLDLSVLDEMPKSRKEVITKIIEPEKRAETYRFIREEVRKGRQVFVICPRIEGPMDILRSDLNGREVRPREITAEAKAVKEEYEKLSKQIFPDLRVAMLHGKMKSKEKDAVMRKFSAKGGSLPDGLAGASGGKNHEIDILVSTSVVEVGVDIPNATIIMIEGAERFGLAQLHQFRGRVGRGAEQSYCFLFPAEPSNTTLATSVLPRRNGEAAKVDILGNDGIITRRLRAVVDSQNGFELAEKDLEIRGAGDLFGARQWGVSSEVLKGLTNPALVREVRKDAVEILQKDSGLKNLPLLRARLQEFQATLHRE